MTRLKAFRQKKAWVHRRLREWRMIAKGLLSKRHPVLAHIIPIRRCNLACTYCNEYDDFSPPVPLADVFKRIDRLASFGTTIITISGGEPMLHPELDQIIGRVRHHGIMAGLITNGYLLTAERIERLNRAGLEHLQISIDNIQPDDVSKKSLKVLDKKLQLLAEHAEFGVNINSVIGAGIHDPEDAVVVARRAVALGLTSTLGVIHDGGGQMRSLSEAEQRVYRTIKDLGRKVYARFDKFQEDIAYGRAHNWRCRAGGRYLYICEDGLVHYCSQQRGYPAVPLEKYTREDLWREYHTRKSCAPHCTVSCVQQVAMIDNWRSPQTLEAFQEQPQPLVQLQGTLQDGG
ncbi:MAG: radical SAM protein [Acidobacteria bacterium]|nr:radical SAM protein [Acidobacteriota bacterium]